MDALDYNFVSNGAKGELKKLIKFTPLPSNDQIYNLALGTIEDDEGIDYKTPSRNGDMNKVLGTIGAMAYVFSEAYPDKLIFLSGDTDVKTRLYQMAINNAHDEINDTFIIRGLKKTGDQFIPAPFEKGVNYDAFLFKRKMEEEND